MHKAYLYGEAKDVLNRQLGGGFPTYNTLQEAFRAATDKARPGEVIMLAPGCASTDQFHDFRERGNVFKTIAKEWLES
jgi:UDP-N-acetylmuramoylalanine--D-glutamate ligase